MNKTFRNNLNALNLFKSSYYRPTCGNYICLPIGGKVLLLSGPIPIIFNSSYSTGDFLLFRVIFVEEYDVLLNPYFLLLL